MKKTILFFALLFVLASCNRATKKDSYHFKAVSAIAETEPVYDSEDAADDPAIWINKKNPSKSFIIGTNKKRGYDVYNLHGKRITHFDLGKVNNVDVRYGFVLGKDTVDVVGATNRSTNSINLMRIDSKGNLTYLMPDSVITTIKNIYGFCLYQDKKEHKLYAMINGKDGSFEQYLIVPTNEKVILEKVRAFKVGSITEGMVADDEYNQLYIAEENVGIWKYGARPESGDARISVLKINDSIPVNDDIEGLTIYYAGNKGYLLASSQGNNSYAVFDRTGENKYLGSFRIVPGITDGTEDTDGIDVTNVTCANKLKGGFFVAQDGNNTDNEKKQNQNFKIVPWKSIADSLKPGLLIAG